MEVASSAALTRRSAFPTASAAPDRRPVNPLTAGLVPFSTHLPSLARGLGCRAVSRDLAPVPAASDGEEKTPVSAAPVYTPTPPNRELRTPHSGYHFDGTTRLFFEGWYFKVSIPECRQSFCFMYSVENPAFPNGMGLLDNAVHGPRFTGVGAQILGPDDKYICQFTNDSKNFWGSRHELMLGNTFVVGKGSTPPFEEIQPQDFRKRVSEGFQVTPLWHQGFIRDDGRSNYVQTVKTARWEYSTRPVYGWGDVKSKQKSTAGWLAAFPVFEPHWQICMAGGLSTGINCIVTDARKKPEVLSIPVRVSFMKMNIVSCHLPTLCSKQLNKLFACKIRYRCIHIHLNMSFLCVPVHVHRLFG